MVPQMCLLYCQVTSRHFTVRALVELFKDCRLKVSGSGPTLTLHLSPWPNSLEVYANDSLARRAKNCVIDGSRAYVTTPLHPSQGWGRRTGW